MHQFTISTTDEKGQTTRQSWQLPESWSEVGEADWSHIIPARLDGNHDRAQLQLLYQLSRGKSRLTPEMLLLLEADQLEALRQLTRWMLQEPITGAPFPHIRIGRKRYLLPHDQLRFITLIEFAFLDFHYMRYIQHVQESREEEAEQELDKILTYMLRPADQNVNPHDPEKFKGDRREMFNMAICNRRIALFQELPAWQRYACLFFFAGCKQRLHEKFKGTIWVDGKNEEGEEVIGARPQKPEEWIRLAYSLSGKKFGPLEQTMYTPLETVLMEIVFQQTPA